MRATPRAWWLAPAALLLASSAGCLPGCFPLLPDEQRVHVYDEPPSPAAPQARAQLQAWLSGPGADRDYRPRAGEGAFRLEERDPAQPETIQASYTGYCASPPAKPDARPWLLKLNLRARVDERGTQLEFRDVLLQWPTLGDNPEVLTHGDDRAPRKPEDMQAIVAHCLDPLRARLLAAMAPAPAR